MQINQPPILIPLPFAANGVKNAIPEASQITITPGAASLNDGFPVVTMEAPTAGGVPPSGKDMNGILYLLSATARWSQAGGSFTYNAAFATDPNVSGYPRGAVLLQSSGTGFWFNTVDNNQSDPDAGGAGWLSLSPDWNATSGPTEILNKPVLAVVATSGNYSDLNGVPSLQPALGFTPVQQGGGGGQGANKIYIGWGGSGQLLLEVDSTNFSNVWPISISGAAATLGSGGNLGQPLTFDFVAQPGQPEFLWGGNYPNDTMYVYEPSALSVAHASTADTAANGGVTSVNGMAGAVTTGQPGGIGAYHLQKTVHADVNAGPNPATDPCNLPGSWVLESWVYDYGSINGNGDNFTMLYVRVA